MPSATLWSPDQPHLYTAAIALAAERRQARCAIASRNGSACDSCDKRQRAAVERQAALPARLRRRQHRGAHRLSAIIARRVPRTAEAGAQLRVQRRALPLDDAARGILPGGRRSGPARDGGTARGLHAVRAAAQGIPARGARARRAVVPESPVAPVAGVRQRVQPDLAGDRRGAEGVPRRRWPTSTRSRRSSIRTGCCCRTMAT